MIPKKPSSPIFLTNSSGKVCALSLSITPGNNSVCAKSRAASRIIKCSSVKLKSIIYDYYIRKK